MNRTNYKVTNHFTLSLMLACFLIVSSAHAQTGSVITLQGYIKDEKTLEPIAYAHAYVKDSITNLFVGTITDLQGKFVLHLPGRHRSDSMNVTFVGYESLKVPIQDLVKNRDHFILLRQSVTILPAVIFRDLTAQDFFTKCVAHFESNYLNVSFLNSGFHWQSTKENDVFKTLMQGNVVIQEDNFKGKVDRRIMRDLIEGRQPVCYNNFDSLENILYFDLIRSTSGIMNKENLNEWIFSYVTDVALPENYVRLLVKRKDNLGTVKLLVNDNTYAIEEVDFSYKWNANNQHRLNDTLQYGMEKITGRILYNKNRTKYNLKYLQVTVRYHLYKKINHRKAVSREVFHELVLNTSSPVQEYISRNKNLSGINIKELPASVVVNTQAYCDAINALNMKSNFCPTGKDQN